jgi:hypothetical protein
MREDEDGAGMEGYPSDADSTALEMMLSIACTAH